MTLSLLIFIVVQLFNVFLSTVKSILTVNGSKWSASIINAVSYTFGAIIIKLVTQQTFLVVIVVTFITNLIGVYLAKLLIEKTAKEKLWTIVATIKPELKEEVEQALKRRDISFTLMPAFNDRLMLNVFSYTRAESALIKEILESDHIRYTVIESIGKLE